ncbi:MAG: transaldolase [bacterium]|nr:transaldolase [bacterium]
MNRIDQLSIKLFADGAEKSEMLAMAKKPWIKGFTTNPTLMHKAGIKDYQAFALDILQTIPNLPISFEVFSDDFEEMYSQALLIASWGSNVYVKIPVCNTRGQPAYPLIKRLALEKVNVNVTAVMTLNQVDQIIDVLTPAPKATISIFAGRIADTGRDPVPIMQQALKRMQPYSQLELIWASPRELLNIFQANAIGCSIITVSPDILKKINLVDKNLEDFSLETVCMFRNDAIKAGFHL